MKSIAKVIPIICIIVTTILTIIFLDLYDFSKYLQFDGYKKDFVEFRFDSDISINTNTINNILSIAKENNCILAKENISSKDGKIKNIYLSLDNVRQFNSFITEHFRVVKLNDITGDSGFFSTSNHNSEKQIGLILDFLNNNYYNYYLFDDLISNNENLYGQYIVYYHNYSDFSNFVNQVENIVGQDISSMSYFHNLQNEIFVIIVISVIVIMIFYFIFQIYDFYYKSKKIGCMKLLGFDTIKITNKMCNKKFGIYILIMLLLIITSCFIPNITLKKIIILILINIFVLVITYLINLICAWKISKNYQISNILKNQNIAFKISKTSSKLKIMMIIVLIIVISLLFQNILLLSKNLKIYRNSKGLLNYGIIYDFMADSPEIINYNKHTDLYGYIINDNRLSTFYSKFNAVITNENTDFEFLEQSEKDGTYFPYAVVDINYLINEKIIIYDLNGTKINYDNLNGIYFLFPKSKINKIELFQKFILKEDNNIDFKAYLYDDQKLKTYILNLDQLYVYSPIVKVIDDSVKISYIESSKGISVFGNGLGTGLKIKIVNNDKNQTFNILNEHIQKAGLGNLIGLGNFLTFREYFNDEINIYKFTTFIISLSLIIILGVYIMISVQVISLYVKSEKQKVIVKYLLGFNKTDIFCPIINKCIIYNIIAFIITIPLLLFIGKFNIYLYLIIFSVFMLIDYLILLLIIKYYDLSKVYLQLKGGNYD